MKELTTNELKELISKALSQYDGDTIASITNQVLKQKVKPIGPDIFEMEEEVKKIKFEITVEISTNKTSEEVRSALIRGIYRGLDSESNRIAAPKDVEIKNIAER